MESDWAYLPQELLELILRRLWSSSQDYLRFSLVCMPWFSLAKDNQHKRSKMFSDQEPPMLLFFNKEKDGWNLYNVLENKILNGDFRLPNKRRFCGSSKGWLVVVEKNYAVTLIKPFFSSVGEEGKGENEIIHLPRLGEKDPGEFKYKYYKPGEWDYEYYIVKAKITADPILNANECIVVVVYGPVRTFADKIAYIRPGKDRNWTYVTAELLIEDILQCEEDRDKFFAHTGSNLYTFNTTFESNSDVKCFDSRVPAVGGQRYLVKSNEGDLLTVSKEHSGISVLKFDFGKCEWVKIETLGDDLALFVGESIPVSVVASNFPGCRGNCIYYTHDYDYMQALAGIRPVHNFGVYDMENKSSSKPYSTELLNLILEGSTTLPPMRPIWFRPTFQL